MATSIAKKAPSQPKKFLERTSLYGFELFMSLFGLVTTLVVLDYGVFTLCNYLTGGGAATWRMGDFAVWIVVAMIVWLPVTLVFYLRSRAESQQHPLHAQSALYKVLISIYYFALIVGAIGLVFMAVYMLVRLAIDPSEVLSDAMLRMVLPALVAAALHVGMMFAYPKFGRPSRTIFAGVLGAVSTILIIALLVVSAGQIRSTKQDDMTENDLSNIQTAVLTYGGDNAGKLPASLSDLSLTSATADRLDRYEYHVIDDKRYELCADFLTDTTNRSGQTEPVPAMREVPDVYPSYWSFRDHTKGRVCFKLRTQNAFDVDKTNGTTSVSPSSY